MIELPILSNDFLCRISYPRLQYSLYLIHAFKSMSLFVIFGHFNVPGVPEEISSVFLEILPKPDADHN